MELHSRGHVSSAGNLLPHLVGNLIRNFRTALPQYCFVVAEMGKSLLCRPQREISIYHYEVSVKLKAGNLADMSLCMLKLLLREILLTHLSN